MKPRGVGPWYVGLFFNLAPHVPANYTEIRLHGNLSMYAALHNAVFPTDHLVAMMTIGPFMAWNDALGFYLLWAKQAHGKNRRLRRGYFLYERYKAAYELKMWCQAEEYTHVAKAAYPPPPKKTTSQQQCIRAYFKNRPYLPNAAELSIKQLRTLKEQRLK